MTLSARDALAAVPREQFVPDVYWIHDGDGLARPRHREDDPRQWQALVGDPDQAIITQVDDGAAEGVFPTSSASAPSIMGAMIDALDLEAGMRVLEIGTGTGHNAAVLAHMLGAGNVVTIEIDPGIAAQARQALKRAGYPVQVVAGDGELGYPPGAPFDRVIVTAAAHTVPYALVEQTRPGGIILLPWAPDLHPDMPLARLRVTGDGTAEGRFIRPSSFMPLRGQRLPAWTLYQTQDRWSAGAPDCTRLGVTVTPAGQSTWLDRPGNPVASDSS